MADKSLKERVLDFRAAQVVSQAELARLCGVHTNTIQHIEHGKPVRMLTAAKVTKYLNRAEG